MVCASLQSRTVKQGPAGEVEQIPSIKGCQSSFSPFLIPQSSLEKERNLPADTQRGAEQDLESSTPVKMLHASI